MRSRVLLWMVPVALLCALPLAPNARAVPGEHDPEGEYAQRRKKGKCLCHTGQASWQYLRSPLRPPADPPVCGLLRAKGDCSARARPKGTSGMCWSSQKDECFWKRHAYSYGIKCSECWEDSECAACDKLIGKPDPRVKEMLERQLGIEGASKKRKLWIAVSPKFYVVTDMHRKLKVRTDGGAPRVASGHEVAHLFAERCERAYDDFVHWFGGRVQQGGPMGVYLMSKQRTAEGYAARYLGSPRTDMLYGGGSTRIGKGFAFNGFVGSLSEQRSDDNLHAYCRHMIGHILFSCWRKVDGKEKYCPKWAFLGAAHFMEKLLEPHEDFATFCSEETSAPSGSGKEWHKKARALAGRRLEPIETLFGKHSMGAFTYADHIQCWSLMDTCIREDRERWLQVLAMLRMGEEEGRALKDIMGLTPDQFRNRWLARLRGARPSMGEIRRDARRDPEEAGRAEREKIRSTQEADILAGLVRGVHRLDDKRLAEAVVSRLDHESDLVRESIQVVLERTTNEEVLTYLREEGLTHSKKLVRAGVARALGDLKHAPAREALELLLEDSYWLARANAAYALSMIGDERSFLPITKALDDRQPKSWIAIADAAASFGKRDKDATIRTAPRLNHSAWQVRVTACRALARFGTEDCMEALIDRFELEKGRFERELRAALKAVSNDDLGPRASTWRAWWKRQQERYGGFDPNPPPKPPESDEHGRYAKPPPRNPDDPYYYGRRIFSRSVGFVFDTSSSMDKNITISKGASTRLGDIPTSGTRMQVAKQVLADAIKALKSRVRFTLVFFSTTVRPWKKGAVQASPGNTSSAASAVMNAPASGETNIHGALKAALGLHEKSTLNASLDDIPDTVYFLTDGAPTRGEITSAPELLSWFADVNRFGKVKLHVVAFGNLGVDLEFLAKLAAAGDGDFIHVPEE